MFNLRRRRRSEYLAYLIHVVVEAFRMCGALLSASASNRRLTMTIDDVSSSRFSQCAHSSSYILYTGSFAKIFRYDYDDDEVLVCSHVIVENLSLFFSFHEIIISALPSELNSIEKELLECCEKKTSSSLFHDFE